MTTAPAKFDYVKYCETGDALDCFQTMADYTTMTVRVNASTKSTQKAQSELRRRSEFLKSTGRSSTVYLKFGSVVRWGCCGEFEAWGLGKNMVAKEISGQEYAAEKS